MSIADTIPDDFRVEPASWQAAQLQWRKLISSGKFFSPGS